MFISITRINNGMMPMVQVQRKIKDLETENPSILIGKKNMAI